MTDDLDTYAGQFFAEPVCQRCGRDLSEHRFPAAVGADGEVYSLDRRHRWAKKGDAYVSQGDGACSGFFEPGNAQRLQANVQRYHDWPWEGLREAWAKGHGATFAECPKALCAHARALMGQEQVH